MGVTTRNWQEALDKTASESKCRACGQTVTRLQAAHIIPRSKVKLGGEAGNNIVPLCGNCHRAYDAHELDILPYLTPEEQACAVLLAPGLLNALKQTTGRQWVTAVQW